MSGRDKAVAVAIGVVVLAGAGHHPAPAAAGKATLASVTSAQPANVRLGQRMAAARGWAGWQWTCLYLLWDRESGWSRTAENPRSGAYGIAQALGHGPTNQYPAGPANPPASSARAQIGWGLGYIAGTYGTPCGAWGQEQNAGWY
jgi:resuscitation-promoting factor RpfB